MKLLIIGGVAGGAAAAARARRLNEDAQIIMFERGEYVSFANCGLPYYAGDVVKKRQFLLVQTPRGLKKRFNIDVRVRHLVKAIDPINKTIQVKDLATNRNYSETYDKLILSPGAEPIVPAFEGVDLPCVHTVRTVPDIDRIKEALDLAKVKRAVVIGAGFIGLEMSENLRERGVETYLVEKMDQVMPPFDKDMAVILEREIMAHDVRLYLNEEVVKISMENNGYKVHTASGKGLDTDLVIMAIGVRPETNLAKQAGLKLGSQGIVTDAKMKTSDESIYAIGDVVESFDPVTAVYRNVPLAGPAAKQALVAVNNIFGIDDEYAGTIGTSIVKVFNLAAAMTGASEKTLKAAKINHSKVYTHPADHVGYYPGAVKMAIKLLYDPDSGIVLGAQIVGKNGVDRKTDVLAVAVKQKMLIKDLAELELCYAPPYGTSKDAINLIGMTALNHKRDITKLIQWEDILKEDFLLDTRTVGEYDRGNVPNSVNIPVDELRERLNEIPKNRNIAVFCQYGVRAHVACRILNQHGYRAANISGGYVTFVNYRDAYKSSSLLSAQSKLDNETFCSGTIGEPVTDK
ncbi:MAG: FAD-dependent oxidoreductase [Candidatus Omnitrophica bacterium]|nr:FAD-dependent oxidoreductase [Candidatus Omnitrophota bacterium]